MAKFFFFSGSGEVVVTDSLAISDEVSSVTKLHTFTVDDTLSISDSESDDYVAPGPVDVTITVSDSLAFSDGKVTDNDITLFDSFHFYEFCGTPIEPELTDTFTITEWAAVPGLADDSMTFSDDVTVYSYVLATDTLIFTETVTPSFGDRLIKVTDTFLILESVANIQPILFARSYVDFVIAGLTLPMPKFGNQYSLGIFEARNKFGAYSTDKPRVIIHTFTFDKLKPETYYDLNTIIRANIGKTLAITHYNGTNFNGIILNPETVASQYNKSNDWTLTLRIQEVS